MFDPLAFAKSGVAAKKRADAAFYKGFTAVARDSDMRRACGDDPAVALGAMRFLDDLLSGTIMLSPEHDQGAFRDLARQRGLDEDAERKELQDLEDARKPLPKRKSCEVVLATEPDQELATYLRNEGFKRVCAPDKHSVAYEGLAHAASLKAYLHPNDSIVFKSVFAGTRQNDKMVAALNSSEEGTLPFGVSPYIVATVEAPDSVSLQKASNEQLTDTIVRIGQIEGPLSKAVLVRRLRATFQVKSIRAIHDNKIDAAIQTAIDQAHLKRLEDGFLIATAVECVVPRFRTSEDEGLRATSNVSRIEIRSAVTLQMERDPERDPAAIVIRTARMLGFASRTQYIARDLSEKINDEVAALIKASNDGGANPTQQQRGTNITILSKSAVD